MNHLHDAAMPPVTPVGAGVFPVTAVAALVLAVAVGVFFIVKAIRKK